MLGMDGEHARTDKNARAGSTMVILRWLPALLLIAYTAFMYLTELATSQEYARIFFSDIGQPYRPGYYAPADGHIGYGINTTLSSFLLACSGVLLLHAAFVGTSKFTSRECLLFSQALILLYMALDDRLMLHERIGDLLLLPSTLVFVVVVALNGLVYLLWFRVKNFNLAMVMYLVLAGVFFFVMMIIDDLVARSIRGRLAMEDLCKVWAGYFFLRFAWSASEFKLVGAGARAQTSWLPEIATRFIPSPILKRILL